MHDTNGAFYFLCGAAGTNGQFLKAERTTVSINHLCKGQEVQKLCLARASLPLTYSTTTQSWLTQWESKDDFCTVKWDNCLPAEPRSLILFWNNADFTTSCMKNRQKSHIIAGTESSTASHESTTENMLKYFLLQHIKLKSIDSFTEMDLVLQLTKGKQHFLKRSDISLQHSVVNSVAEIFLFTN